MLSCFDGNLTGDLLQRFYALDSVYQILKADYVMFISIQYCTLLQHPVENIMLPGSQGMQHVCIWGSTAVFDSRLTTKCKRNNCLYIVACQAHLP